MISYVDPVPSLVSYLAKYFEDSEVEVVGKNIPADMEAPTILCVINAGGSPYASEPYTRVKLLGRADVDYMAHEAINAATNELERYGYQVKGVRVLKIRADGRPIDAVDPDTDRPEAWSYILVHHLEA